jgi:CPA2 family monovalent cation:H+ antiporter-2
MILVRQPLPVLATLAIIVVGKSVAALAIVRVFGRSLETGLTIAASLAQIGEFSFILAALGMDLGLLPKEGNDLILAGAILSILLNPILFAALDRWQVRREAEAPIAAPADDEETPGPPLPTAGHVVLIGFGRVGSRVGRVLHASGHALALIESDRDALDAARALGIAGLLGNASSEDVLAAANTAAARAIVVAIPQTIEAGQVVEHARALKPGIAVIARAHTDQDVDYLLARGADAAIMGEREIARGMIESIESLDATLARLPA